jgi:hypothetical protein
LAIAPNNSGTFCSDLLVGHVFDGKINSANLTTQAPDGSITVKTGPSPRAGLWGLPLGNGKTGDPNPLYLNVAINNQKDSLLSAIAPVLRLSSIFLLSLGLAALVGYGLKRWYDMADARATGPLRPSARVWQL